MGREPAQAARGLPGPGGREQRRQHRGTVPLAPRPLKAATEGRAGTELPGSMAQAAWHRQRGTGSAQQQGGLGRRTLWSRLLGKHGPRGPACQGKAASTVV